MISSDVIRGHIDTLILKLLIEKDMYGYELANEIKNRTQDKFNIKEATLYSVVQRLEGKKIIASYMGEKTHGGKRRYYKITPFGKAYYSEMISEWKLLKEIMVAILGSDIRE
ncbi:MAG: PadR family transcriptional regulator [Tenericutes bacterium HGW-Tenericutes-1]|jgi:PadR family transcriptional regulator PadR|nr:MAG: PadR family transcriptional regulator [Tenericutes bacterium HGW-Tenericutes-1]